MLYPLYRFLTNQKYRIQTIAPHLPKADRTAPIDLSDVTFAIPVKLDSEDRENNLNLVIDYLNHHFITNIIVCDESSTDKLAYIKPKCTYIYHQSNLPYTHKTKAVNLIAKMVKTPIIAIWDTDALVEIDSIIASCEALRENKLDSIYPYNGIFEDLPQSFHQQAIDCGYDLSSIPASAFLPNQGNSVGGAILFQQKVFMAGGMMNENFKSYGWEDNELLERFYKLGYRIGRVNGVLVHLSHYRGENSSIKNIFSENNKREFQKIKQMNRQQTEEYVRNFDWLDLESNG
jgi:GT2 family glycosyltransferase